MPAATPAPTALAACLAAASASLLAAAPGPVDFNREIRPILAETCFACHGPDRHKSKSDLALFSFEQATRTLESGQRAIVPGDRKASALWQRIHDREDPMPPADNQRQLDPRQIELLGRWIDQGAPYADHWAYVPPVATPPPAAADPEWSRNEIDRFLLARLAEAKVPPAPAADPVALVRRATLDLAGLPPTPAEVDAFVAAHQDEPERAWAELIDRLLASDAHAEVMAGWWLDLVRYGDSVAYHGDQPRRFWPYRDWVIKAFKENLPYDRFVTAQLAGDLLPGATPAEANVATGYLRLHMVTAEGGAQVKEYQAIYDADRVQNFGETFLAATTGCAQCHDHKYDPWTAADYYSLAATMSDPVEPIVPDQNINRWWGPFAFVPQNDEQRALLGPWQEKWDAFCQTHPDAPARAATLYERYPENRRNYPGEDGRQLQELVREAEKLGESVPTTPTVVRRTEPRVVRLLPRGNWMDESGPPMSGRPPRFLPSKHPPELPFDRLALARWVVDPANPLTARVVANRLWALAFGEGLARNLLDFGAMGETPTHPALLDSLALTLVDSGWDLRALTRKIFTSRAYRMASSHPDPTLRARDPENRLLARQNPTRLRFEQIRDQALAAAGLLETAVGGPSVYPYQPEGHWDALNFPRRQYPTSSGADLYRRSLYIFIQQSFLHPLMTNFDVTNRQTCLAKRLTSNTPLQALTVLNETGFVEAARQLAQRAIREAPDDPRRIERAFRLVLARAPGAAERQRLAMLLESQRARFAANPSAAAELLGAGASAADPALDPVESAALTQVCRAILNLHESLTRP